jgi:HEAT repeat protein
MFLVCYGTSAFDEMIYQKIVEENTMSASTDHTRDIDALIAAMAEDHGLTRLKARQALVAMKQEAIAPLVKALQHPEWRIRWGAAKALGQIGDPSVAEALIKSLEDERPGIRWLAAEALIALRPAGLHALLEALIHHSDSSWLREGAHHIIHDIAEKDPDLSHVLAPVAAALDDVEPVIEVPPAAQTALRQLTSRA